MGVYLNPGNKGFETIVNGVYVDKTGLIEYINGTLDTPRKLTCFSRPRRFGKSFAAKMLCAYYDRSCDSQKLFAGLEISKKESFTANLNRYDVIYLDITWFISRAKSRGTNVLSDIQAAVIRELRGAFPDCVSEQEAYLPDAMLSVSHKLKRKFFVIIDEWDALFRESKDDKELQREYVQLLRGLFKGGTVTDEMIVGAYMTGLVTIKNYGPKSALTSLNECSIAGPAKLAEYVGFTEPEVRALCAEYDMDFENMRTWYDGYSFSRIQHIYSPNSVMNALQDEEFQNYWTESETYESLTDYITQDFGGLKEAIVQMLGGQRIAVDISTFQNDFVSFKSKDDVITLLIHLGYMAYDDANKEVYIPNLEVADAFRAAVKGSDWTEVNRSLMLSDQLLKATVNGEAAVVAEALELAHEACASSLAYNDENSLSCAILLAYYTAKNEYEIFRELPTGKGFADYAFIPRKGVDLPAMVIELKYNKSADSALKQIHDNRYEGKLKGFGGRVLLVGINYDKEATGEHKKHHSCVIEEI